MNMLYIQSLLTVPFGLRQGVLTFHSYTRGRKGARQDVRDKKSNLTQECSPSRPLSSPLLRSQLFRRPSWSKVTKSGFQSLTQSVGEQPKERRERKVFEHQRYPVTPNVIMRPSFQQEKMQIPKSFHSYQRKISVQISNLSSSLESRKPRMTMQRVRNRKTFDFRTILSKIFV